MIALVDLCAFFASIEQRDTPEWRGRPIGITNGIRGTTIITASYEARAYGVTTGTRVQEARQRCPGFIQVPSRPEHYSAVSSQIMAALEAMTPTSEIFSVDEAFLDLTHCQRYHACPPAEIGRRVQRIVQNASGLLCSVGISGDKTTAKWAAGQDKGGVTVVAPWDAERVLVDRPVTELCGIAGGIGRYLAVRGVVTSGQMKYLPISALASRFGHPGRRLWLMAQGRDPAAVAQDEAPSQTIGHGKVIPPDTHSHEVLALYYFHMAEKVGRRLRRNELEAQEYAISLKTAIARIGGVYKTVNATDDGYAIYQLAEAFLKRDWVGQGGFQVQITAIDPRPCEVLYSMASSGLNRQLATKAGTN